MNSSSSKRLRDSSISQLVPVKAKAPLAYGALADRPIPEVASIISLQIIQSLMVVMFMDSNFDSVQSIGRNREFSNFTYLLSRVVLFMD